MKRSYRKKIVLIGTPSESYAQMVSEFVRMVNESREIECVTDYALSPETMNEKMKTLKPDVILVDAWAWRNATRFKFEKFAKQYRKYQCTVFCFDDIRLRHAAQYLHFGAVSIIGFRHDPKALHEGLRYVIDGKRGCCATTCTERC